MKNKNHLLIVLLFVVSFLHAQNRVVEDFNHDWKFSLENNSNANQSSFDDKDWRILNLPHDWSIELGYQKDGQTAASTGFVPGGIGWYRKSFSLNTTDKDKHISVFFNGVYNNSDVWINGHFLGNRPNGYSSFSYNLTDYLKFDGSENLIAVKVNRTAYVDSRWYTGSGIYRKVELIKKSKLHIEQWGVQITTPIITKEKASVHIKVKLNNVSTPGLFLKYSILDAKGNKVATKEIAVTTTNAIDLEVKNPKLWSTDTPTLYKVAVELLQNGKIIDNTVESFGLRSFNFDANTGFSLNGKNLKIKGVNLHHDAGAVGSAVPKGIWEFRVAQLKSIGVNAIRFSHNPHSIELLDICDQQGILVMDEAFDEWHVPKDKSKVYLGDNAASKEASKAYPEHFNEWAERDLKDLILRDFNHPSVFMWSIGNEIEWTFPHYSKTFNDVNKKSGAQGYEYVPIYDKEIIKPAFDKNITDDPLAKTAKKLVTWVKEMDTTRPVTCGSVLPSVGMVSGYGTAVDVFGYNYRASDYDVAHKTYPELKIIGSENWGDYKEWKSVSERDFVPGIFVWTGFAYLGEAGPWPRKGLNISFFDFAGFKTPRGHFFECLWMKEPKVYVVTTPVAESEFSFNKKEGWKFDMQLSPPPVWNMLRKWEWYKTYPKWKYKENEPIVVQTYTNCEEAELFLNGQSLGKQKLADFKNTDNIIKWLVPYTKGTLKVVGYNKGKKSTEYVLRTTDKILSKIKVQTTKKSLDADGYDVAVVTIKLLDKNGNLIVDNDQEVVFDLSGPVTNMGVDNGWEMSVQPHKTNTVKTHLGQAALIIQSTQKTGKIKISVSGEKVKSGCLKISSN